MTEAARDPAAADLFASDMEPEGCPCCGVEPCARGIEIIPVDGVIDIYDAPPVEEPVLSAAECLDAWRSPAISDFIDRRAALHEKHGDKAVTDQARPPAAMAKDLKERASALLDRLAGREPDAERAALALNSLATLGALALALHQRLTADLSTFTGD